jgi:hypothetical protein
MISNPAAGNRPALSEGLRLAVEIAALVALGLLIGVWVFSLGASLKELLLASAGIAAIQPFIFLQRPVRTRRTA